MVSLRTDSYNLTALVEAICRLLYKNMTDGKQPNLWTNIDEGFYYTNTYIWMLYSITGQL